jgi:hypothetical protein
MRPSPDLPHLARKALSLIYINQTTAKNSWLLSGNKQDGGKEKNVKYASRKWRTVHPLLKYHNEGHVIF